MSGGNFHQGDAGGDTGKDNQQIEQEAHHIADPTHGGEGVVHGHEQQARAALGRTTLSKHCGEDCQTGQNSSGGISCGNDPCVLGDVGVLIQIRTIGDHNAHAQRAGEQHLTGGHAASGDEVKLGTGHFHTLGGEHIHQALRSAGQGEVVDDDDDQNDKQSGDANLVELLDAAFNTAGNDDIAQGKGQQGECQNDPGSAGEIDEEVCAALSAETIAAEDLHTKAQHIAHGVTNQHGIETHDDGSRQNTEPADDLVLLAQFCHCQNGALTGLAADRHFDAHADNAAGNDEEQINDQEREAAVGTHFVRESPQVTHTDGRADRRQNKS